MEQIGKYSVMLFISFALCYIHSITESKYFSKFFIDNAILLGATLFTIHAAFVGILVSQLVIMKKILSSNFKNTVTEIRRSFAEALILLFVIITCAIIVNGNQDKLNTFFDGIFSIEYMCYCLSLTSIMALIMISVDSANAILIAFENIDED